MSFIKKNLVNIIIVVLFSILLYDSLFNSLIIPETFIVREHSFYYYFILLLAIIMVPFVVKYFDKVNKIVYVLMLYIVLINIFYITTLRSFIENVSCLLLSFFCYIYGYHIGINNNIKSFVKMDFIFSFFAIILFCIQNISVLLMIFSIGNVRADFIFCLLIYVPLIVLFPNKLLKIIGLSFIFIMVLFSGKRSALLAYCIFFISLFLIYALKNIKFIKLVAYVILIVGILFLLISIFNEQFNMIIDRFANIQDDQGSGRVDIYSAIINDYLDSSLLSQLFGHGHRAAFYVYNVLAHNDVIQLLYDYGIVGVLLMTLFLLSLIRRRYVKILSKNGHFYYAVGLSTLIFYVVIGLLNCVIYAVTYLSLIFLVIGMCRGETDFIIKKNSLTNKKN